MPKKTALSKPVFYLGMVSLLTDTASEAIYPLLSIFLMEVVGASFLFIGVFEGVAEAVASLTKFFSGFLSDRIQKRTPFVIVGYFLSNSFRPFIGLVTAPWQALCLRFIDRAGKGTRGAPRDAWLAQLATSENRGWVFGFHRAMDHTGAIIGPLLASAFLWFFPKQYRPLFLLTLIPGLSALIFIFLAKRATPIQPKPTTNQQPISLSDLKNLPSTLKRYLVVLGLFTLGNSSDAFIILKLKASGVSVSWIPLIWSALHVVKMSSSTLGGRLSDRLGRKIPIISGWLLYSLVFLCLAFSNRISIVILAFLAYGLFYGLTESPERALIADLVHDEQRGTAYGLYNLVLGLGALPASLLFGVLWEKWGSGMAFSFGSTTALLASLTLASLPLRAKNTV